MDRKDWVWMGHPAHLIISSRCRFHLATYVGGYIVSTVGEYLPEERAREIIAQQDGVVLEGQGDARLADYMKKIGFVEVGYKRKYETMVFKAGPSDEHPCCPYAVTDWGELDMRGYNEASDAHQGHLEMCTEWAAYEVQPG